MWGTLLGQVAVYSRGDDAQFRHEPIELVTADNGLECMMLLEQGAASFELWTGRQAPRDLMRERLEATRVAAGPSGAGGEPGGAAEPGRGASEPADPD